MGEGSDAGGGRRILLVDDEPDILASLKTFIEMNMEDVEVVVAESGQEALDILDDGPVDLAIVDYKMAGMDGLEFLEKAREQLTGVPRLIITAYPDLSLAIEAINRHNIDYFFVKPVQPEAVIDVVKTFLEGEETAMA